MQATFLCRRNCTLTMCNALLLYYSWTRVNGTRDGLGTDCVQLVCQQEEGTEETGSRRSVDVHDVGIW